MQGRISFPLRFVLFSICIFYFGNAGAQLYNFKKYNTKNGLANSTLNSVIQTENGYLWFGTQGGGLCRFDGKDFKTFTKLDGLISNDITSIVEDKNHNLWIGTVEGVCLFDGLQFKKFDAKDGVTETVVYNMFADTYGDIWIPTSSKGLKIFRDGKFITIDTLNGLGSNFVFGGIQKDENTYWIGTYKGGLTKMDRNGKILKRIDTLDGNTNTSIFCFMKKSGNEIYLGSNTTGIYKMVNDKISKISIPDIDNEFIGSIIQDSRNNIWIGSTRGLVKYHKDGYKVYREYDGLSSEVVNALCEDYEGNIWIATSSGGVCVLKREAIVTYTSRDGLNNNRISSVFRTSDGSLFVSPQHGGLSYLNSKTGKFESEKLDKEFENASVSSYCELPGHILMLGMEENGVLLFDQHGKELKLKKRITSYKTLNGSEPINTVSSMLNDHIGHAWVGSFGHGIFEIDGEGNILAHYDASNSGLLSNEIITLGMDGDKRIIAAGLNHGIQVLKNGRFEELVKDPPEALKTTWSIDVDKNKAIFFGTQDGGLIIYSNGKFVNYNTSNGLCSNFVLSLLVHDNTVWIGTDKGVNKIKFDANYQPAEQIRYYGTEDGFIAADVNLNSIFRDENGDVWFGTPDGLTKYNEKFDYPNTVPPKLILADIKLFYEHVDWKQYTDKMNGQTNIPLELSLPFNKNHFTFNFRALTLDNVKYSFILENLDDDWSPGTPNNQAVYTNIPPGTYTFKVIAKNSFGVESKVPVEFTFTIRPPFWKTWWFYTISTVFVLGGLILFFRWRTANLEK
jgi:ligand-binding sensor domain-containing protein